MTLILETCRHAPNCSLYISSIDIAELEFLFYLLSWPYVASKGLKTF